MSKKLAFKTISESQCIKTIKFVLLTTKQIIYYKKLQCVLLLLFVGSTQSQIQSTYEWLQVQPIDFQWNYELIGYATVLDNQGNVYLAGYKENGIPYGVYVLGDVFLNKYDSNGQLLFTTDLGGEGAIVNLKTDSSGNVLLLMGFLEELQGIHCLKTPLQGFGMYF